MENTLNTRINAAPAIETNNDADLVIHPSDGHFELLLDPRYPDSGLQYKEWGGACAARFSSCYDIDVTMEHCPPGCTVTAVAYYLYNMEWWVLSPWNLNPGLRCDMMRPNTEAGLQVGVLSQQGDRFFGGTGVILSQSLFFYQSWKEGAEPNPSDPAILRVKMQRLL